MIYRLATYARRHGRSAFSLQRLERLYSSLRSVEQITIPCQSHGAIRLDIHHPLKRSPDGKTPDSTVLLYLPRGPFKHDEDRDATFVSRLQSQLDHPIVQVNYRLGQEDRYPTPVHDVLSGYDWVVKNMLPKRAIARVGRSEHVGKLAVCGELIGGGLATMLALTECRVGEPGIVAAAVHNPLVDWVSLTDMPQSSSSSKGRRSKLKPTTTRDLEELIKLRGRLFKRPDEYFDPFASPILFFRSSGVEVPPAPEDTPEDDMEYLSILERESMKLDEEAQRLNSSTHQDLEEQSTPAPRRVSRRFPSKMLRLRLPSFHVTADVESPLREQTEEFIKLYGKSLVRQSKDESDQFGRKILLEDEGELEDSGSPNVLDNMQSRVYDHNDVKTEDGGSSERTHSEVARWLNAALGKES